VHTFERRLAALEGGERCVATSSGMSAILSTALALLSAGDEIVASRSLFGSTVSLFDKYLGKFGITTRYVELSNVAAWEAAITPKTRLLFAETPSNPLSEIADIPALAALAKRHDALLAIDNCFLTPALQQPLALGADLVIHSATKYLDGQGRAIGGAVVGSHALLEEVFGVVRTCGPCLSPFNAWIFTKGLETLSLRMKAHCENALILARWLDAHPAVNRVFYSGLEDHPQHALAKQQQKGFGAVLGFEVKGGQEGAWQVIDATRMLSITGNLGDVKTTITHPATTTHGRLSDDQKDAAGIAPGLIRVAVGLESQEDIQRDLARGLDALAAS
jgi:O-succinylhomoserine sulfhydrylase